MGDISYRYHINFVQKKRNMCVNIKFVLLLMTITLSFIFARMYLFSCLYNFKFLRKQFVV